MAGDRHEVWVALPIGLLLSLLIHVVLLTPAPGAWLEDPPRKGPPLGSPDAPEKARMAWISHDAFRAVRGPASPVKQPALQTEAPRVPDAPAELDPTAAAPLAQRAARKGERAPSPVQAARPVSPFRRPEAAAPRPSPGAQGPRTAGASAELGGARERAAQREKRAARAERYRGPSERDAPRRNRPGAAADAAAEAPRDAEPRPTRAARSEKESATSAEKEREIEPGNRVRVGPGLEIVTKRPRFSAVTRSSAMPRNPVAELTFSGAGRVIGVRFLRRAGHPGVDGPVLASLYAWRARGPRLERIEGPWRLRVRVLLVGEN